MTFLSERQSRVFCGFRPLVLHFAAIAAAALILSCSRQEAGTVAAPSTGAAQNGVEDAEVRFPRRLASEAGTAIVHVPQIDQWIDYRKAQARVALEVTLPGQGTLFGTGHVTAATETDLDARTVTLYDVTAERFVFSGGTSEAHEQAAALVRSLMRKDPQKVPLDLFLNYLQGEAAQQHAVALNMEPPPIFVAYASAILVITNGKPAMAPVESGGSLKFAVNTNWDLFQAGKQWYLRNEDQWLTAADPSGAWSIATQLPQELSRLPDDKNWNDARTWIPPSSSRALPQVFFVEKPAELILIDGKPALEPIGELGISYVRNTASDVFKSGEDYYYLASGRWFTAPALDGKWRAATPLPAAFASIPTDHPKARVRASVPGTPEALRAMEEVAIPRTAVLNRSAVPSVTVTYDGAPKFAPIAGTTLTRASNSMYDVISDGTHYYLCYDAVWYKATGPTGPWTLADSVPPAIYSIPPSSPSYHLTSVKVYDSTPTTVTSGYTGGYYGAYSTGTTVVFGTGYAYPPYIAYAAALYPIYYWHPYSYGYGSWYNPNNGAFGEAIVAYGPYGGAARTAAFNPSTGTYRRGYAVWDENEIAGTVRAYNPRTGTGAWMNGYATEDAGWAQAAIMRGDEWAYAQRERHGDTARTEIETSRGGSGEITSERDGDTISRDAQFSRDGHSITSSGERTDQGYSGSFQTSGGASGTVQRSLDDGELSRDAQISRDGRTVDVSGTTERTGNGLETKFETSGGASGTINREVEDGYVQRSGEFSRNGQTAETEFVRGSDGSVGRIESGGETVGVGRTENGDLYASKDGEVYRRTDDGWEQHDGNGWKSSQPSAAPTAASTTSRTGKVNDLDKERSARTQGFEQYGERRRERQVSGGGQRQLGGRRRR